MPTKVYLNGDVITIDQTGETLLNIRTDRARWSFLEPTFSEDGLTPVPIYIQFDDIVLLERRTEKIIDVQDQAGNPFANVYDLISYLSDFFQRSAPVFIYENKQSVKYQDSVNLDAFGRLRTSGTGQRLDVEYIYNKQDDIMDEVIVGAGTVVHQSSSRDLILKTNSVVNGDKAEMASYPVPYTPGNSQLIAITGTINEANIAGGNAEIIFRSTVSGSLVETVIEQDEWNIDTMSQVDWTNSQILEIDFQSLKVGRIRFALNQGGVIVPFHQIINDNVRNTGYWQQPSLPLCWKIYNDATYTYCELGYGNSANGIGLRYKVPVDATAELRAICGTVKSEGGQDITNIEGFSRKADMGRTTTSVASSLIPVLSIRPRSTFNSLDNLGLVIPVSIGVSTDNPIRLVVIHDAVLTGASWVDVDTNESHTEYDVSASSFANGHEVFSDYISTSKNTASSETSILGKTLLWDKKGTRTGIITIAAVRTTSTTADVLFSLRFREIR